MKNMTRAQRRRQAKIRKMLLSLSLVLVIGMTAVGGTIAWLTAQGGSVTNVFTPSDINIELTEPSGVTPNYEFKMIPGATITKDAQVVVKANSEACYLFVKIEKSENYSTYLNDYVVAEGWNPVTGVDGVYYRNVAATTADSAPIYILKDNQVTVKDTVKKSDMTTLDSQNKYPTLKFTAYAIQSDNLTTSNIAEIWALAQAQ